MGKHRLDWQKEKPYVTTPSWIYYYSRETARLARTICPTGTLYMHIGDRLGTIYENQVLVSRGLSTSLETYSYYKEEHTV